MIRKKLVLLALLLLLIPVGLALGQSSASFIVQRFTLVGGGSADSASYKVTSVIGQPATGSVDSAGYQVTAGFLQPGPEYQDIWLPLVTR